MNFAADTTLITVAYAHPALLEHQLDAYLALGRPLRHVVWVNDFRPDIWAVVEKYLAASTGALAVRTSNIGYMQPLDVVTELCQTSHVFIMPTDFRVTRPNWMSQYESWQPADAIGIPGNGCLSDGRGNLMTRDGFPPHLRIGGLLLRRSSFRHVGKFGVRSGAKYSGEDYAEHVNREISLTADMLAAGMTVKVIENPPIYDYGHWGSTRHPDIGSATVEELRALDAKYGVTAHATT